MPEPTVFSEQSSRHVDHSSPRRRKEPHWSSKRPDGRWTVYRPSSAVFAYLRQLAETPWRHSQWRVTISPHALPAGARANLTAPALLTRFLIEGAACSKKRTVSPITCLVIFGIALLVFGPKNCLSWARERRPHTRFQVGDKEEDSRSKLSLIRGEPWDSRLVNHAGTRLLILGPKQCKSGWDRLRAQSRILKRDPRT